MSATAQKVKSKRDGAASHAAGEDLRQVVFNLPNQLTWLRLLLAVALFGLIAFQLYLAAMVLFLVAAGTDWLDGYFARKYDLVTTLGRILDPFADKVIICGTFIYLASIPAFNGAEELSTRGYLGGYLWPSMAVVVVARELLVTALRSFLEQQGADFSANMAGKMKMVIQCAAAALSLYCLHLLKRDGGLEAWLRWTLIVTIWSAVGITIYSGAIYIGKSVRLMRG